MLSVIITGVGEAAELERLLAELVPAAVDGLVRDVLLAAEPGADSAALCEDAGVVLAGSLAAAARLARSDRVLMLPPDLRLAPGWREALAMLVKRTPRADAVVFGRAEGLLGRLGGRAFGVLLAREQAGGDEADLRRLRRTLRPGAARIG